MASSASPSSPRSSRCSAPRFATTPPTPCRTASPPSAPRARWPSDFAPWMPVANSLFVAPPGSLSAPGSRSAGSSPRAPSAPLPSRSRSLHPLLASCARARRAASPPRPRRARCAARALAPLCPPARGHRLARPPRSALTTPPPTARRVLSLWVRRRDWLRRRASRLRRSAPRARLWRARGPRHHASSPQAAPRRSAQRRAARALVLFGAGLALRAKGSRANLSRSPSSSRSWPMRPSTSTAITPAAALASSRMSSRSSMSSRPSPPQSSPRAPALPLARGPRAGPRARRVRPARRLRSRAARDREGGRPMSEPRLLAESGVDRGLVFLDTDHGFNLAFDPAASARRAASSKGIELARWRGDGVDRLLWAERGQPPAFRYRYDFQPDNAPARVSIEPPLSRRRASIRCRSRANRSGHRTSSATAGPSPSMPPAPALLPAAGSPPSRSRSRSSDSRQACLGAHWSAGALRRRIRGAPRRARLRSARRSHARGRQYAASPLEAR